MKNRQKQKKVNKSQCGQRHFDCWSIAFQRGQNTSQTSINAGQSVGDVIADVTKLNAWTRVARTMRAGLW